MEQPTIIALITAISVVLAPVVPSVITLIVSGKYFKKRDYEKLEKEYLVALKDIEYLLQVESFHCRRNSELLDKSYRRTTRTEVDIETTLSWSGRNNMKRVFVKRKALEGDSHV